MIKNNKHIKLFEEYSSENIFDFLGYIYIKKSSFENKLYKFETWTNIETGRSIQFFCIQYIDLRMLSNYIFINTDENTFFKNNEDIDNFFENSRWYKIPNIIAIYKFQNLESGVSFHIKAQYTRIEFEDFLDYIQDKILKFINDKILIKIVDNANLTYINITALHLFKMIDPSLTLTNTIFKFLLTSQDYVESKLQIIYVARSNGLKILDDLNIDYLKSEDDASGIF